MPAYDYNNEPTVNFHGIIIIYIMEMFSEDIVRIVIRHLLFTISSKHFGYRE